MPIRCINCGFPCQKYGKTRAGSQRWYCTRCNTSFVNTIDNSTKRFTQFITWLFSKDTQEMMPGKGRTFRRHTAVFWDIWPMPPKIDTRNDILFVDGIYLSKKACILICYDGSHVLVWYVCRSEQSRAWVQRLFSWRITFRAFLSEMTRDSNGNLRSTHERLLKAYNSLVVLIKTTTLFTYLDDTLQFEIDCPSTNNAIEGGVNAQLRSLLRNHRGMSIERRIKAVFWWCYLHSPRPLSIKEILRTMPTGKSIAKIYKSMNDRAQLEGSIPTWGDAIVWSDLHNYDKLYFHNWD